MSLEVNIRKSFSSFTLDVAFEAGDETLGFWAHRDAGRALPCDASPASRRLTRDASW